MTSSHKLTIAFIFLCWPLLAQPPGDRYRRPIEGIQGTWNRIALPNDIFAHLENQGADLRIRGINEKGDTVDAPYLLHLTTEKVLEKNPSFKIINQSHNKDGYFFTFDVNNPAEVNRLTLNFKENNFDWRTRLEGSQDQKTWFVLTDQHRIVAIDNNETHFKFSEISFPPATYRYYRLLVKSPEKPELLSAQISDLTISPGNYRDYPARKTTTAQTKSRQETEINIQLDAPVPVSHIDIHIADQFDYYRPITFSYLRDSFKTEKGWRYQYSDLLNSTLSSIGRNDFTFAPTVLKDLRITISNGDNTPLHPDSVHVSGYVHELWLRIDEHANYYLYYGNPAASAPGYDLERFIDKIPDQMTTVRLGAEEFLPGTPVKEKDPLFKNKAWLWGIMLVIIVLLGWFSLRMLRKDETTINP